MITVFLYSPELLLSPNFELSFVILSVNSRRRAPCHGECQLELEARRMQYRCILEVDEGCNRISVRWQTRQSTTASELPAGASTAAKVCRVAEVYFGVVFRSEETDSRRASRSSRALASSELRNPGSERCGSGARVGTRVRIIVLDFWRFLLLERTRKRLLCLSKSNNTWPATRRGWNRNIRIRLAFRPPPSRVN